VVLSRRLRYIDVHTHIGEIAPGKGQTVEQLIGRMDHEGIDASVVLSIENPEETYYYVLSGHVIAECKKYPDRLIPFCCVDPRRGRADTSTDFLGLIEPYVGKGAKGFGEYLAGVPIDDPRSMKIFEACGYLGIPVLLHMDTLRNTDSLGLPGFRKVLKTLPQTTFIAHGPGWWREISGDVDLSITYPKGPVVDGGAVKDLLATRENVFGDLSAGSGFNALERDRGHALDFLTDFSDRLLFGTDCVHPKQKLPLVSYMRKVPIPMRKKRQIARENTAKLFGIAS
jgi:predicted TIM-barrel fold metal-dependent hydrolase